MEMEVIGELTVGEKMTQVGWVHMHTTFKRIELESPGCSEVIREDNN